VIKICQLQKKRWSGAESRAGDCGAGTERGVGLHK